MPLVLRDHKIRIDIDDWSAFAFVNIFGVLSGFNTPTVLLVVDMHPDHHIFPAATARKPVRLIIFLTHTNPNNVRLVAG